MPSVLHFADAGVHHSGDKAGHHAADGHHDDAEVDVDADAVSKLPSFELPVLALVLLAIVSLLASSWAYVPMLRPARFRLPRRSHFRPPLRGPPAFSFA